MVKNVPANTGDVGLISELGISSGEETATHSNILAWRIPWTEGPGGLQSTGLQSSTRLSTIHFSAFYFFVRLSSNQVTHSRDRF